MGKQLIHFIVYKSKDGWRWHARRSGKIVADGGEAYARCGSAYRAVMAFTTSIVINKYDVTKRK